MWGSLNAINVAFGDGFYHPFMVICGMVSYRAYHIIGIIMGFTDYSGLMSLMG
jgi:hypothetical protein